MSLLVVTGTHSMALGALAAGRRCRAYRLTAAATFAAMAAGLVATAVVAVT
jgi:hypothetical protein